QGKVVVYTVAEPTVPDGYIASYAQDTLTVTNTYMVETTDVTVSAIWKDSDDQDGMRPESITLRLMKNGVEHASKVVTAADDWSWTFTGLAKYEAGKLVNYTIKKDAIAEYDNNLTGNAATGFTVTCRHVPETTDVTVSAIWKDSDDQDGMRPESITLRLMKNGVEHASKVVTAADGWSWTFTGLAKYEAGKLVNYTIKKDAIAEYDYNLTGNAATGFTVTYVYTPTNISIQVTKAWEDDDNKYGSRPTSVVIKLFADGIDTGKILVLNDTNDWSGVFTDLSECKYDKKVIYTIKEVPVDNYTSTISGDVQRGYIVTNCYDQINLVSKTGENKIMYEGAYLTLLTLGLVLLMVRRKRKESDE
ncbi:MAG TPA: Cna B-type domain-containing protein, partial [Clostridiaceae bacterium]|nr:Cna B-type domain-containing protein [Clostridiaceae bacterium]